MKKTVLIRLDKIGDLVCTLPVDQIPELRETSVIWVIAQGLGFLPVYAVPARRFLELNKNQKWSSFWKLIFFLKRERPDVAVSFQGPWWVSLALFFMRIPVRAGVRSQWHSFLFLNRGLRQRRSQAIKHESDYNIELLSFALNLKSLVQAPVLKLQAPKNDFLLARWKLEKKKYYVVHPGMAGSALNWTIPQYKQFISELIEKNHKVVLTGTPQDEIWLTEIKNKFQGLSQFVNLQNHLSPVELLTILKEALAVVAPSTGIIHLAASLETPVISMFSPVQVQHPRRWAARGPLVEILLPAVNCPAHFECLKEKCPHFFCMEQIEVQRVLQLLPPPLI